MRPNSTFTHRLLSASLIFALLLSLTMSYGQSNSLDLERKKTEIQKDPKVHSVRMAPLRSTPSQILFDTQAKEAYTPREIRQILNRHLNLRQGKEEMRVLKRTEHLTNTAFIRYQQYFEGIKVEHGQYIALVKEDKLASLNGEYYQIDNLNTRPSISEASAIEAALNHIGAEEYVWEYIAQFQNGVNAPKIADALEAEYELHYPKGELVIVDDYSTEAIDLDLAYKFNIYANKPLSRDWVYVNAHDGRIMLTNAIIKHASVQTRYNGIKDIFTTMVPGANPSPEYAGDTDYFILLDETRGNGIQTYDMNGLGGAPISVSLLYNLATDLVDDDDIWSISEHVRDPAPTQTEVVNDDIAWDAHWGAAMVYDYWKERHNRDSYDGNNAKINSYVHYGEGYDNAFWNGSVMTYGDGSYRDLVLGYISGFSPLTSLDVCAHEIGHAVCEHTSDLVYRREAGAMNEGFSDIWAACVENYVLERYAGESFDYKPWGIGEQIDQRDGFGNLDKALRWMDDPKRAGDPDTYGGDNWINPECGEPTLANDYCGVHTNSGVLNKWFYLLTAGSGNAPDDGVNDHGTPYNLTGLGFAKSEIIAFGTEVLLSPNATFAEARAASIAFARATYGSCSVEEEVTTNAWYAVGVGPEYNCEQPLTTGFLITEETTSEAADGAGFCEDSQIRTVEVFVNLPVTYSISVAGTATPGSDYLISGTTISHAFNNFATKSITIEIIDDAAEEGEETIILQIPSGAGSAPGSDTYTLTIRDDDVAPVVGIGPTSLLYERFISTSMPSGWGQKVILGENSLNTWHFGSYQGTAYISATGLEPDYEGNNNETTVILHTPLLDARGLSDLRVSFDWSAGGETDVAIGGAAPFDYGALMYSFDGDKFFELGHVFVGDNLGTTPASGTLNLDLGEGFSNQQFYLGWRWINDPLVGTAYSFTIDNVRVNAETRRVESDMDHSGEEYLGPQSTVFFYSADDGELLATVTNNSNHDYGCTTINVERAGTGAESWFNGGSATSKAIHINPENPNVSGDLEISVYYSEAELSGWENSTGASRDDLNLFNSNAANISGANGSNTTESNASHSPIYKTPSTIIGGKFTATVNNNPGSIVLATASTPPALVVPEANDRQLTGRALQVFPNPAMERTELWIPDLEQEQEVDIRLININGQEVKRWNELAYPNQGIELTLPGHLSGIYLILLSTEKEQYQQKLVIE